MDDHLATQSQKSAMIMAGGTGGHIFPGLALAHVLRQRGWQVFWLGAMGGMELDLVPKHGFVIEAIPISGVRRNGLKRWLIMPFMLLRALISTTAILLQQRPQIVIGFGGYPALPGGIISWILRTPLIIHEQNAVAGLTNRLLSKLARRTLFAFPNAFPGRSGLVGNPVRPEIIAVDPPQTRFAARVGALTVLVIGGSRGAWILNETLPQALSLFALDERPTVVHQAGVTELETVQAAYQKRGIRADCHAFIDDMAREYARADIVVCRAGALTIAELAAVGVASILVPLSTAVDDHQTGNSRYLTKAQAAYLLPEDQLSAQTLYQSLRQLTREKCLAMALRARKLALVDADERIADICESLVQKATIK